MWKLIRLEWKKNHIGTYIIGALILAGCLGLFVFANAFWGIANDPDGTLDAVEGKDTISAMVELFTSMAFLIFTCVMLSAFVVSAYRRGTMNLMFSYPIKRQKILVSQMLAVWIFNFVSLTATKLLIYTSIYIGAKSMTSSFGVDFDMGDPLFYVQLLAKSFVLVSMSFIALFVGLAMKSSKATIVASFVLIFLTQANVGDLSLAGNAVLPVLLTVVSFVFAALSVCGAERKDLR